MRMSCADQVAVSGQVRPTSTAAGSIKLTATAKGLKSASATITTTPK